jgi:peptidyl-prolyl cis-trans isomerase D
MLKQLSRLEKTRNILILGFVIIMAISLVMFYKPGNSGLNIDPGKDTTTLAKVRSSQITVADLAAQKASIQERFGGQVSLAQLGLSDKTLLDQLIAEHVAAQEAERLGFAVGDRELEDELAKEMSDPTGRFLFVDASGKRDITKYQDAISQRYGSVERYEEGRRRAFETKKLRTFVGASVTVSPEEVQNDYKRKNTTFDLTYAIVSPDKLAEKIPATDQDLHAYYEQHKTDYRYDVPQKRIRYLYINQEKAGEKLQISDDDLRKSYDQLDAVHKQAGVKVQQIFLKVRLKELDSQVEEKAKDLVAKARAVTGPAAETTFSDLAKGNSEDPATQKTGGLLGRIVKKNPNKVDALYDRAVDMEPGDITDPIRYGGNWYILRRGESVPKTFEEAKAELLVSARNQKAFSVMFAIAARAKEALKQNHDVQKVAQQFAAEANMSPADMVRETPLIKPGDDVKNIGSNQQFESAIANLNNPNDIGEPTQVKEGIAIPMFVEKKDPRIPDFDEVKEKLTTAFKQQKAKEQLDQKAKELAGSATSAADLKAAIEKAGFEASTDESFKLGSSLGKAGTGPALDEAVYGMKEGEVSKTPIKIGENLVVVGLTKRNEADLAEFAKQRDQLTETMLRSRQDQVYEDFVAAAIERMKKEGKVKIYKDVLDKLVDEEEPAPAPRRPRIPFPTR